MCSSDLSQSTQHSLTGLAAWIYDHNVPFLVTSIGMIVMLLWAGSSDGVTSGQADQAQLTTANAISSPQPRHGFRASAAGV